MIKTFTSYHHANDQKYKEAFVNWASASGLIDDISVQTGEIDEGLPNQSIRTRIRDHYLRDSDVTVLLCGTETRYRKHVDWELKSSMIDGAINRKSGILVIDLPESKSISWYCAYGDREKELLYPDHNDGWFTVSTAVHYENMFPDMPRRIIENLNRNDVAISVVPWNRIYQNVEGLRYLLQQTKGSGSINDYDTTRPMRMKNFNPKLEIFDIRV